MEKDYMKTAKELRDYLMTEAREPNEVLNPLEIYPRMEKINAWLSRLISPMIEAEVAYRTIVVALINSGETVSKAEAQGKITEEYKEWRKLQEVCKRGDEGIRILKKWSVALGEEYKRT